MLEYIFLPIYCILLYFTMSHFLTAFYSALCKIEKLKIYCIFIVNPLYFYCKSIAFYEFSKKANWEIQPVESIEITKISVILSNIAQLNKH
jgi:hypothetical protein